MSNPAEASLPSPAAGRGNQAKRALIARLDRHFYFAMSIVIAAVVVYGFSQTINPSLFHPPSPRPAILYVHGAIFSAWIAFLIVQSALIRSRNAQLHRKLGWFGS